MPLRQVGSPTHCTMGQKLAVAVRGDSTSASGTEGERSYVLVGVIGAGVVLLMGAATYALCRPQQKTASAKP